MDTAVFQNLIKNHYRTHGRDLPWKKNITPYKVLVSEIMLQQTQVDRVVPKYNAFMKVFPSFKALANASKRDVLKLWQGLGYNRRALNLKKTAEIVTQEYNGRLPKTQDNLEALPGIGPYTAGAIRAFAYNAPALFIETNIRSVFIHHFFKNKKNIHDKDIFPLIEKTLDTKNPRDWYYALMDYGSYLKTVTPNPSRQSTHHTKQSKFKGSDRQIRGAILQYITQNSKATLLALEQYIVDPQKRVPRILDALVQEGFLEKRGRSFFIHE